MIIGTYYDNPMLKFVVDFYMNCVTMYDYRSYFDIYLTDNIKKDYALYEGEETKLDVAGVTILPHKPDDKIIILVSKPDYDTLIHELTHMCDFVEFSKQYCNAKMNEIKDHNLYQTFVYWSEFHVKLFDIPYLHVILGLANNTNKIESLKNFSNEISSFYYPAYTQKMLNKITNKTFAMRDIMWYLGEIVVCNLYDKSNEYYIDENIISHYNFVEEIYDVLKNCLDVPSFVYIAETLDCLIRKIVYY